MPDQKLFIVLVMLPSATSGRSAILRSISCNTFRYTSVRQQCPGKRAVTAARGRYPYNPEIGRESNDLRECSSNIPEPQPERICAEPSHPASSTDLARIEIKGDQPILWIPTKMRQGQRQRKPKPTRGVY